MILLILRVLEKSADNMSAMPIVNSQSAEVHIPPMVSIVALVRSKVNGMMAEAEVTKRLGKVNQWYNDTECFIISLLLMIRILPRMALPVQIKYRNTG